jgi:ATP-dependent metalloprotease FtsH
MFRRTLINNFHNLSKRSFSSNTNAKLEINDNLKTKGLILGTTLFSSIFLYKNLNNQKKKITKISIKELKELENRNFEKVDIFDDKIVLIKKSHTDEYYQLNVPNGEYFEKHIQTDAPIYFNNTINWSSIIGPVISLGIFGTVIYMMTRNVGGLKNIMEVNKPLDMINQVEVKFKDVIGQKNARRSVQEFVDIIKNKEKYQELGVTVPKGALLSGPPGTGKTLIAKAIAGESELPFVNMTGSDFNAMFVGVGSAKIKNLYNMAKKAAEEHGGCIVFIDEIDAIGQKRSSANTFGGNSERENTLNQLLTEMDGFDSNRNVITFAATNRPELLDPALLRPGRFDRKITVDLPTLNDREELFNYYLDKLKIDKSIIPNISQMSSRLTPGFSGADIANVVNEAGIISVRKKNSVIQEQDIKDAIDYVILGDEKEDILLEKEKDIVSYHEAGHAYLSYILPLVENPLKVSIIPREKGMLGFSQSEMPIENLTSKKKMEQYLNVLMAGRASEEIFFEDITNGASNDIEKATQIAKQYVKIYGFSDDNSFMNQTDNNPYKSESSDFINNLADKEIIDFLNFKYQETLELIKSNQENITLIKESLLENKTIYYQDMINLIDDSKIYLK